MRARNSAACEFRVNRNLIDRLRAAQREDWSMRIRPGAAILVSAAMADWLLCGLTNAASLRVRAAVRAGTGARLSRTEAAALDADALAVRLGVVDD